MEEKKFKLFSKVIERSISKNWEEAKKEWEVIVAYEDENFETCLCSHYPIKEVLVLKNKNNNAEILIGNCCINKFFGNPDWNKFFGAIVRRKLNGKIIEFCFEKGLINYWEFEFCNSVWRKRILSPKQKWILNNIKERIFKEIIKEKDGNTNT